MSAYSDWKVGALSDEEYAFVCAWEDAMDKAAEERMYADDYDDEDYDE